MMIQNGPPSLWLPVTRGGLPSCFSASSEYEGMFSLAYIILKKDIIRRTVFFLFLLFFQVVVRLILLCETCEMFRQFYCSTKTTQPHPLEFSVAVAFSGVYAGILTSFSIYRKRLSNLATSSQLVMKNQAWDFQPIRTINRNTLNECTVFKIIYRFSHG